MSARGACSSGCPSPGSHSSWGECQRAKNIKVAWCQSAKGLDATAEKKKDRELAAYRSARAQGIQPGGTSLAHTTAATAISDASGRAFDATIAS